MIKPMLAEDYEEGSLVFPLYLQPKIDGVRCLKLEEYPTGRSLKQHANKYTTQFLSNPIYDGLDGELAASYETDPALCRKTSSALSTKEGEPNLTWHVFDIINKYTRNLIYSRRYEELKFKFREWEVYNNENTKVLKLVPTVMIYDIQQLRLEDTKNLDKGYEGSIIRDPNGLYKEGRSTVKEGGLLRIKHFIEEDATVLSVIEGETNGNEKVTNLLGRSERSSYQENMSSNGLIGSLICKDIKTGKKFICAAGTLTVVQRKFYFENQHLIVGQIIKYKYFPKGIKDKPRFPTFQSFRITSDIII
jgi:DNA ligase-1